MISNLPWLEFLKRQNRNDREIILPRTCQGTVPCNEKQNSRISVRGPTEVYILPYPTLPCVGPTLTNRCSIHSSLYDEAYIISNSEIIQFFEGGILMYAQWTLNKEIHRGRKWHAYLKFPSWKYGKTLATAYTTIGALFQCKIRKKQQIYLSVSGNHMSQHGHNHY